MLNACIKTEKNFETCKEISAKNNNTSLKMVALNFLMPFHSILK